MKFPFLLLFVSSSTAFAAGPGGTFRDVNGPEYRRQVPAPNNKSSKIVSDVVHRWNQIAIDATGLDHTPVAPGENRVFGEQLGPGRASRAMAIVHIAIFDVVNALNEQYQSFTGIDSAPHPLSIRAAVAQAAHDTLAALYRSQKSIFDQALAEDLLRITSERQKTNGIAFGKQIAAAILASRVGDGSEEPARLL